MDEPEIREREKQVIVFYPERYARGRALERMVRGVDPDGELRVFHLLEELQGYFQTGGVKDLALILVFESVADMQKLIAANLYLDNQKLILVLPGQSREIINIACAMLPSYMTFEHNDFADIAEVLAKLKGRFESL